MGFLKKTMNGNYSPFPWMVFNNGLNTISHLKNINEFSIFFPVQCGVSGLRWNDFMLMTDLTLGDQGVHVERIYFDETWHGTSLPKLTDFYFNHIMPALLQKS